MNLYNLTVDYEDVKSKAFETLDEETGEIEQSLVEQLCAIEAQFKDKAVAYGCAMRELKAQYEYAKKQADYYMPRGGSNGCPAGRRSPSSATCPRAR